MENWYARPVFFVRNCEESLMFYNSIGFNEKWKHEEEGEIIAAQVNLKGTEIILNKNETKAGNGRIFISLSKGEVNQYLSSLKDIKIDIEDKYWGMPTKAIKDIDSNDILLYDDSLRSDA